MPVYCLGEGSCKRHLAAAAAQGVAGCTVNRRGIGLDVDEPPDLATLLSSLEDKARSRTAELLLDGELGARIEVALGSLQSAEKPFAGHGVG